MPSPVVRLLRYPAAGHDLVWEDLTLLTFFYGGEMWRQLLDVRDAARAYLACLNADEVLVKGQIFNVSSETCASELALRVR